MMAQATHTTHEDLTQLFKALSDPTRLRMVRLLAANEAEMCVCEFVDCLQERQYNVSRQLKVLEASGLVVGEKEGRWVYYGLAPGKGTMESQVYKLISKLPLDDTLAADQKRFEKRMGLRSDGRCQVGIQTSGLDS